MSEKLQFFAVFQTLQPHCGMGNRYPIKMKLCQSNFLANRQLLWGSAPQKFQEWFLVATYDEHYLLFRKLVKVAYI